MTFLDKLSSKIRSHKERESDDSYVASLNEAGLNKILEKVGEEAEEGGDVVEVERHQVARGHASTVLFGGLEDRGRESEIP